MKLKVYYERKVIVPIEEYKNVTYTHGAGFEYNEEETKKHGFNVGEMFDTVRGIVDEYQRQQIKEETGITKLIFDLSTGQKLRLRKKE